MRDEVKVMCRLAWPTSLGMLAFMGMNVVDTLCVGQLGSAAQAAVSITNGWGLSGAVLAMGIVRAIEPIVAQSHGEGDKAAAGQALVRMLVLAIPLGLLAGGWYALAPFGLSLIGQPATILPFAEDYASVIALSWPFAILAQTIRVFLQSLGIVRPAMIATVLGTLIKGPLNLLLMSGVGPIPALGIAGAAWATLVVDILVLGLLVATVRTTLSEYWPDKLSIHPMKLANLLRVGMPIGVQMGTEFWAFSMTAVMMGWISERAMAAHAVALNLASVSFMLPLGIATAAAARVGHRFGAGEDWGKSARAALLLGAGTQLVSGAVFLGLGAWLVAPYSPDPDVRALAATLMPIAAAFQLFDGMQVIGFGILRGAGDVRVPTLANLLGYYVFGLPFAYFLGVRGGGGPTAIWWGLSIGLGVVSVFLLARIRVVHRRGGVRVR